MNKNEAIEKIKQLLSFTTEEVLVDEVTEVKFLDVTDVDGNVLRTPSEELVIGDIIKLITTDGEELIPDATYVLDDGRTIKTDAESMILTIEEAAGDTTEEATTEEEMVEDTTTVEPTVEPESDAVTNLVRISNLEKLVEELISKQSSIANATMSIVALVEKYGETPVTDEIEDLKSTFSSVKDKKDTKTNALEAIRKMRLKK